MMEADDESKQGIKAAVKKRGKLPSVVDGNQWTTFGPVGTYRESTIGEEFHEVELFGNGDGRRLGRHSPKANAAIPAKRGSSIRT